MVMISWSVAVFGRFPIDYVEFTKIKIPRLTKIFAVSTLTVLSSTAAYFWGVRTRAKGVSENERGRAAYAPYELQNKT